MSTEAAPAQAIGPGRMPAAIALTPILSARYRAEHLQRIRETAPDARLINVSLEGLADADLSEVEVLLRGPLPAPTFDRLIARCPRLIWVHSATAGVERVLTPAALERHLIITNARGVFSRPIAEYVLMMVLAISRRLPQLLELQADRTWQPLESVEMRDLTIGVIGLGSIGRAVAALAGAFGCRVVAVRRQVEAGATTGPGAPPIGEDEDAPMVPVRVDAMYPPERIHEVLAESDFVVLGLPLTPETEDLFDEQMLARMKPGSWLINVARGRLVDERALLRALRDGPLGGAVLDTFRDEPLPPQSPLYDRPNVIVTPHTSWSSGRVLDRSIELFCDNLRRYQAGEPLRNVVDPGLGVLMQIAIVGLTGSGKTTVFNTLTRGTAETGGFGGMTVNQGVVKVPDERLTTLTELFKPKKEVPADVTYVDLPAPPASTDGRPGGDIPADQLARLRNADALIHVVRAFDDPSVPHADGAVDPRRDLERLDLELVFADLGVVERRVEKLRTSGRHGTQAEREANERELAILERILPALTEGRPIRDLELTDDEEHAVRGFRFLTEKPVMVLLNVDEKQLAAAPALVESFKAASKHRQTMFDAMAARIEMEIGELDEDEAAVFREELGVTEPSLERVIRLSYRLLGLISFFTAGPDETRAWTLPDGSNAVDAAEAIHSDLARGFIRAEVVTFEDLVALRTMAEARKAGKLRSEGKTYRVKDGDVIEILFNV